MKAVSKAPISMRAYVSLAAILALASLLPPSLGNVGPASRYARGGESLNDNDRTMTSFQLVPGVIADSQKRVLYLMNPDHGIDAIDAVSGKVLWSTANAAKPLLLVGDRLIAEIEPSASGHDLGIAVLDASKAGAPLLKADIPLPDRVTASIDEGLGATFSTRATARARQLIVSWTFSRREISGINRGAANRRVDEIAGAARVDLNTGRAQPLVKGEKIVGEEAPAATFLGPPYAAGLMGRKWRVGSFEVELERIGARTTVKLRTAATGGPLPAIELERGARFVSVSPDGEYLLASKADGADASGVTRYLWTIYSLRHSKRVGEIESPVSVAPFLVCKSILVYRSPPSGRRVEDRWVVESPGLRAVNLDSGTEIWRRPFRDTTYRGPLPPTL